MTDQPLPEAPGAAEDRIANEQLENFAEERATWCIDYRPEMYAPTVPGRAGQDGRPICIKCEKSKTAHALRYLLAALQEREAKIRELSYVIDIANATRVKLDADLHEREAQIRALHAERMRWRNRCQAAEDRMAAYESEQVRLFSKLDIRDANLRQVTAQRDDHFLHLQAASLFVRNVIEACGNVQPPLDAMVDLQELALQVVGQIEQFKVEMEQSQADLQAAREEIARLRSSQETP